MVLARIFAEITVLIILVTLPAVLAVVGQLETAPMTGKFLIFSLSLLAALILPAYAFITWVVKVDQNGLTAMSLAKQQHCQWSSIKRIARRSNWNWVRYIVEHQDGEISFPIWLLGCDELIELIRSKLPKGSAAGSPFRKFSQDKISLLFQCMQAALGIGLVVVFWIFFAELAQNQTTSQMDLTIVLGFCLLLTMVFLWRTSVVVLMPKSVELTPSGVIIDTMLFSRRITWENVLKIGPSWPLLPEGFMLKTAKGSFLIGNGMDAADELVASIKGKLESGKTLAEKLATAASPTPVQAKPNNDGIAASVKKLTQPSVEQTDFTPDGSKSIAPADFQKDFQKDSHKDTLKDDTEEPDQEPTSTRTLPGGKKADRRFRKRKKKNRPTQ